MAGIKIFIDNKTISSLNQSVGEKNQQLVQYKATIVSLSSQKARIDEITEDMYKRIDENAKASKTALQSVLKKPVPQDCKGAVEYLRGEVENVGFD